MITANKKFIIKNGEWLQECEATDVLQVSVGLPAFTGGKVDITAVVSGVTIVPEVEAVEGVEATEDTPAIEPVQGVPEQKIYTQKAYFGVPNEIVYTAGDDIINETSDITVALLEEWNPTVTFTVTGI